MRAWYADGEGGTGCFRACVGTYLDLGDEAADDIAALPRSLEYSVEGLEAFNAELERRFGVRLRQLQRPPFDEQQLWVAAIRTGEGKGHALLARGSTVLHDPVVDGRGRWGQGLPRSFGPDLVSGFVLDPL
jgi:hypothetical protein